MPQSLRILSIDGGGVRGYLPALLLAEVERRAGKPASTMFDLIVGTSTGGIIGIGLALGMTAEALADFYPRHGSRIFGEAPDSFWRARLLGRGSSFTDRMGSAARTAGSPFGGHPSYGGNARHRPNGLQAVLHEVLGETRLSQAHVDLAITSFDGLSAQPVIFSRRDALSDPALDLPLRDVARATSAAPTFFPPHVIAWAGRTCSFVDGGVWANNPAGIALAEAFPLASERGVMAQSITMLSLGTGVAPSGARFAGTDTWIGSAGDLVGTATSVGAGELLAQRALGSSKLIRLQVHDDRIAGAMDDPSQQRLSLLREAASALITDQANLIDQAVSRLAA